MEENSENRRQKTEEINKLDKFLSIEIAARLEQINYTTLLKRVQRSLDSARDAEGNAGVNNPLIRKTAKPTGGVMYEIHLSMLSGEARKRYAETTCNIPRPAEAGHPSQEGILKRKERSDKGKTKADEGLLIRCAAVINEARASSYKKVLGERYYGFNDGYKVFVDASKDMNTPLVSYRQFVNLVKPFIDKELQIKTNIGATQYRNKRELTLRCDYSVYEPMQFIQSDHTPADAICMHDGRIIRPQMCFHNSVGDRVLSYPTMSERPDSFSIADSLTNFVLRYGLSTKITTYKTDNGKAYKAKIITKQGWQDWEFKSYDLDIEHERLISQLGLSHEKGLAENLGVLQQHATPKLPRGKQIERQFNVGGSMDYYVNRPEYTGRKYDEKPEDFEKIKKSGRIWTSEEMLDFTMNKVDEYNNRTHQGIREECKGTFAVPYTLGLDLEFFQNDMRVLKTFKGLIPESMYEVYRIFNDPVFARDELKTNIYSPFWRRRIFELCGWVSRALPARETMAMLAMKAEERTVHSSGFFINNNLYISFQLQPYIQKKIIIRYSPNNIIRIKEQSGKDKIFINEVYCFEKESEKFICIAAPHPRVVQGPGKIEGYAKAFLSERSAQSRELSRAAKINSIIATGKEQESELKLNVIQLNSFRDVAAHQMAEAKQQKREQEKIKHLQNKDLEDELSKIYGTDVRVS